MNFKGLNNIARDLEAWRGHAGAEEYALITRTLRLLHRYKLLIARLMGDREVEKHNTRQSNQAYLLSRDENERLEAKVKALTSQVQALEAKGKK